MRPSREFPQGDSNIVSVRKLLSLIFKSAKQMSLRLQSSMIEHFFSLLIIGRYLRSCSSCSSVWLVSVIDSHQQPVLQLNTSPRRSWSSSTVLPAAPALVMVSLPRLPSSPCAATLTSLAGGCSSPPTRQPQRGPPRQCHRTRLCPGRAREPWDGGRARMGTVGVGWRRWRGRQDRSGTAWEVWGDEWGGVICS